MSNTEASTPTTDEYQPEVTIGETSVQESTSKTSLEETDDDDDLVVPLTKLAAPTNAQLISDKLTGTLENCHVRKAFSWNLLGKLYSSSDATELGIYFRDTYKKLKLAQFLHHGVKISKKSLGLNTRVMFTYLVSIMRLMKDHYLRGFHASDGGFRRSGCTRKC